MANSKEATIIIFDVGCTSKGANTIKDGAPNADFFHNAKNCINRILQRKIFSMPLDEVGMLLIGANATDNQLNSANAGNYLHICEAFDVQCTNWYMLRVLENQIEPGTHPSDWLDAIVVALDMLHRHSAKKIKTYKIVLVSTFRGAVDAENFDNVVQQLRAMGVDLVVITDNLADNADGVTEFRQTKDQTAEEQRSKELIMQMLTETDGVICDFDQALMQLIYFEKKKQRTMPWNCTLELGTNVHINVAAYIQIKDSDVLPWKTDNQLKTKYYQADRELTGDAQHELIMGYRYGDEAVPFDSALASTGRTATAKCLRLIGFTAQSSVLDQHFAGSGAWSVVAQKGDQFAASERRLVALVAALKESQCAAIVRYVYRANVKPRVMALFPVDSADAYRGGASLTMLELIYKDNMTALLIPPLLGKRTEPTPEQLDAVDELIDAMDLMDSLDDDEKDDDAGGKGTTEAFAYTKLLNPTLQHTYRVISHRALHPMKAIPHIDTDLTDKINVPAKLHAAAVEPLAALRDLFPLETVAKKTKELFFAKLNKISDAADGAQLPSSSDAEQQQPAGDLKLVAVGTVTPAEDFAELLRRGERFSDVCDQMGAVIVALVLRPLQVQHDKVGRALMMFREEAKLLGPHRYNDFVTEFKRTVETRKQFDVWRTVIVSERFGLITRAESAASDVDEAQAAEFYEVGGGGGQKKSADGNEEEDDEDLSLILDNM